MTDQRSELEMRRALQQAIQAGDQRAELETRRALTETLSPLPQSSTLGAASLGVGEQILGNIAALPDVAARGFQGVRSLLAGQPGEALEQLRTQQLPRASGRDVNAFLAGVEALPGGLLSGSPVEAFQEAQREQRQASERAEAERPVATGAGQIAGDALTLLGLRAPGVVARGALPARAAPMVGAGPVTLPQTLRNILQSGPVSKMAAGIGKATGAGAEGAIIAMLNDNDPLFTAGAASGAQVAGSLAASALRNPGKTAIGIAATWLALRDLIPTLDMSVFEVADFASQKAALGVVTGILFSPAALRLSGRNQSAMASVVRDAVSALPRGAMQSAIDASIEAARTGSNAIERVSAAMLKDPRAFTGAEQRRVEKTLTSAKPLAEFEDMLADPGFLERVEQVEQKSPQRLEADAIRRRLRSVPEREEPSR